MNPLKFIDKIKEMYNDQDPRYAKAEFSPVFDPDLEQSEPLGPGETLETWKPNPFLKPHAEGGRAGYNDGNTVLPEPNPLSQEERNQKVFYDYVERFKEYLKGSKMPEWFVKDLIKEKAKELGIELADGGRAGYNDGQLVRPTVDGSRPGYADKRVPPIKKKDPARLELYKFIKENPNIEFKNAQDLLKKANIKGLTIAHVNKTIQDLDLESTAKKLPATNFEIYNNAAKEYNQLLDDAIKKSDGTNLPENWSKFLKSKNLSKNTYHGWKIKGKITLFKDIQDTKKKIVDDLVLDANNGLKYIEAQTIAKKSGFGTLTKMQFAFDGTSLFNRKKNSLDLPSHKVQKAYEYFMSDMNKPVESFFNPGLKISKATGLSTGAVSGMLNKYQPYLDDARFMSNLRNDAVQTKIAGKNLTLGQFYDHMQNRILVYEEAGREMAKMGTIEKRILEDAWRHTQQGGTKFEWKTRPGLDSSGNVVRWGDAEFRYKGKGSSGKFWGLNDLNINASEAPEFKMYFKTAQERNKLLNEFVLHPVSGKQVKFGQLMKEVYNIGSGQEYSVMTHQLDHLDLLNDPLGLDPKKGLRILPARINSAAGQVKKNINKYKYKIGKPETYEKYSPANSAQAYDKMGYNYTKNYDQLLNDEYNFAKKVFNKYQAAGWRWNPQNNTWVIKPGFEESANAIKGNIIKRPMEIVEEVRVGNKIVTGDKKAIGQILKAYQNVGIGGDCKAYGGRVGFKNAGAVGISQCMKNAIDEHNKNLQSDNPVVRNKARSKQFNINRTKNMKNILNLGGKGVSKVLRFGKAWGAEWEPIFEGAFYEWARRKGYTHDQAKEETFFYKMLDPKRQTGIFEGAEPLLEKELIGSRWDPGRKGENLVGAYIDNQKRMEEISSEWDSLDFQKKGHSRAQPSSEQVKSFENQQAALAEEYQKLDQLNKPDSLSGYHTAYQTAVEKQQTELGVAGLKYGEYGSGDTEKLVKQRERRRQREMEEKFPDYKKSQLDKMLEASGYVIDPNIAKYKKDLEFLTKEDIPTTYQPAFPPRLKAKPVSTHDMIRGILSGEDKLRYYADNFRMEKAGGGLTRTVAPDSGPMDQGLRSLYINDKDY